MPSEEDIIRYFREMEGGGEENDLRSVLRELQSRLDAIEDRIKPEYPGIGKSPSDEERDEEDTEKRPGEAESSGKKHVRPAETDGVRSDDRDDDDKKRDDAIKRTRDKVEVVSEDLGRFNRVIRDLQQSIANIWKSLGNRGNNNARGADQGNAVAALRADIAQWIGQANQRLAEMRRDVDRRLEQNARAVQKAQASADWVHAYVTSVISLAELDRWLGILRTRQGALDIELQKLQASVRQCDYLTKENYRRLNQLINEIHREMAKWRDKWGAFGDD